MLKNTSKTRLSGNTYYVAFSGSDTYTMVQAMNQNTPWKTINKVNQSFSAMSAGDRVLFNRGDIFSGATLTIGRSGISGSPMTIGSYGSGPKPVLTALSPVSSWTSLGNNLYESVITNGPTTLNVVTVNGILQPIGRYPKFNTPNQGYLSVQSTNGSTTITSTALSGTNWTGAEAVVRLNHWIISRSPVTAHTNNTISIQGGLFSAYSILVNNGFFLQNHINTLTSNGDWAYNSTTKKITMFSNTGTPVNVMVSTLDRVVNINGRNFVSINELNLIGANTEGIYNINSNGVYINECDISNIGTYGIHINNTPNTRIYGNTLSNCLDYGIRCNNRIVANTYIGYNQLTNIGYIAGMGLSNDNHYNGIEALVGSGATVVNNRLKNIGYLGITYNGNNVLISNNVIDTFCFLKDDGAAIYTYNGGVGISGTGLTYSNRLITRNIIMNGIGTSAGTTDFITQANGIYQDGNTNNVNIFDNTAFNLANTGTHNNSISQIILTGNTFYNVGNGLTVGRQTTENGGNGREISNNTFRNNIFFTNSNTSDAFRYTDDGVNFPTTSTIQQRMSNIGIIDSNYWYLSNKVPVEYYYRNNATSPYIFPLNLGFNQFKLFTGYESKGTVLPNIPYYTINSLGPNLYANSGFTNLSGVFSFSSPTNHLLSLDTTGKLGTPNSARLNVLTAVTMTSRNMTYLYSTIGAVSSAKNYILRFSIFGTSDYGYVDCNLRMTTSPYSNITEKQGAEFGTGRTDFEFLFQAPQTVAAASWQINVNQFAGTTYIGNVQVFEANVTLNDIYNKISFVYNDSDLEKTYNLGGTYTGITDNIVYSAVTLAPFTSKLLRRN